MLDKFVVIVVIVLVLLKLQSNAISRHNWQGQWGVGHCVWLRTHSIFTGTRQFLRDLDCCFTHIL